MKTQIESLSHDGRGITHINGKTVFVENALPGETVAIEIFKKHRRYSEAKVIEVIEASPERVTPPCQHFTICGGCQLQHMHPDAQIALKQKTLLEQLAHFAKIKPEIILPPLRGPELGYRHKARLGVKYVIKKELLFVGFREKNGRYLADLKRCETLHPKVGLLITPLKEFIRTLETYQHITQIEVAIDDTTAALVFRHLVDLPEQDKKLLIEFAKQHQVQIYLHPNPPGKTHKIWPEDNEELLFYSLDSRLRGNDTANENDTADCHPGQATTSREPGSSKLIYAFHPLDFTQINPAINQQMILLALELLELNPEDNVLDLFCGLGNFTLPIAKHCKKVTGIEGAKEMIERAKYNAEKNNITNTEFHVANLAEPNPNTTWAKNTYDKILLDPPRTGALEIIPLFKHWKPKRIVYVSCNPATLARDAGELIKLGYKQKCAGVMDMFPHTSHVESIALFQRT